MSWNNPRGHTPEPVSDKDRAEDELPEVVDEVVTE
jgi:hypothetical protein